MLFPLQRLVSVTNFRAFSTTPKLLSSLSPAIVQLKVGLIKECTLHPNADKLYVSHIVIDQGSDSFLTVCSGLVNYVPREELIQKRVVLVTNLKPSKMRGVKSEAMVLAAETSIDNTSVDVCLVSPPESSTIGEELYFERFKPQFTRTKLKTKKWEELQQRLHTDSEGFIIFKDEDNKEYKLRGSQSDDAFAHANLKNAVVR